VEVLRGYYTSHAVVSMAHTSAQSSAHTEENHNLSCTFDPDIKPHEAAMAVRGFIKI